MGRRVVIATRGSALALWQARHIAARLVEEPGTGIAEVALEIIKTRGDKILDVSLSKVGGKGLFVKEIEDALLDGRAQIAVHSMKDVPADLPEGLTMACIPERADARDALVTRDGVSVSDLTDLRQGAVVGTSSLRRGCQLLATRPDLQIVPLRGNVDTRLRKLDEGVDEMDAIVLACAGLQRLGLGHRITVALDPGDMIPAVAQGALGLETRTDDQATRQALSVLESTDTRDCVAAERAFMADVGGSCQVPVGGHATLADGNLHLTAFIGRPDGSEILSASNSGPRTDPGALGRALASELLSRGGRQILAALAE